MNNIKTINVIVTFSIPRIKNENWNVSENDSWDRCVTAAVEIISTIENLKNLTVRQQNGTFNVWVSRVAVQYVLVPIKACVTAYTLPCNFQGRYQAQAKMKWDFYLSFNIEWNTHILGRNRGAGIDKGKELKGGSFKLFYFLRKIILLNYCNVFNFFCELLSARLFLLSKKWA